MSKHDRTPDEIREHLERDRKDTPQTSAPCPGCGSQYIGWKGKPKATRSVDRVCRDCVKLIEEALEARERAAKQSEYKLYFVNFDRYMEGRNRNFYPWIENGEELDPEKHSPNDVLRAALSRMAEQVAGNLPIEEETWNSSTENLIAHNDRTRPAAGTKRWLRPEHAATLRLIDAAIRKALVERTECGEEYGRSLLAGLATGELSIQDFNDKTMEGRRR